MAPELRVVDSAAPADIAERSDDALMALCKVGHRGAFDVLLERHEARVFGFAAKYLGERTLGEEACQETFLRMWCLREEYEPRGHFTAYLSRVCLNVCRELGRSRRRRAAAMERFSTETRGGGVDCLEEDLLLNERDEAVERMLSKLPPRLREAVLLRFYNGLSYSEMVEIVGRSEGTLRSQIHRAVNRMRTHLKGLLS